MTILSLPDEIVPPNSSLSSGRERQKESNALPPPSISLETRQVSLSPRSPRAVESQTSKGKEADPGYQLEAALDFTLLFLLKIEHFQQ
jgi:hypothetical protein